jgi:uncharacterized membrane protein
MTENYATTEDKTLPAVTYALYLLGFATGFLTTIAGVIIAHIQQGAAGPVMRSHYAYLVRTFWLGIVFAIAGGVIGAVMMAMGVVLSFILIGIPIMAAAGLVWCLAGVWFGVRCVVGIVYLSRGEAHPRPYTLLA